MLTDLQIRAITVLLRAGWTHGQIATLLEMPPSIVESVKLPQEAPGG